MSRRAKALVLALPIAVLAAAVLIVRIPDRPAVRPLRVCADPNNLPFSNDRLEGVENRLASLVAREMNAKLEYYWHPQRRGFIRNTLGAGACDVVMGIALTPVIISKEAITRPLVLVGITSP